MLYLLLLQYVLRALPKLKSVSKERLFRINICLEKFSEDANEEMGEKHFKL